METNLQLAFEPEIAQLVSINQEHKKANNGAMMARLICPVATALAFRSQSGLLSYHWQVRLSEGKRACLFDISGKNSIYSIHCVGQLAERQCGKLIIHSKMFDSHDDRG